MKHLVIATCAVLATLATWHVMLGRRLKGTDIKQGAFGIGISLTPDYGTVAVRYASGTVESIGRVEATPEYHKVMARLSHQTSAHPSPPYRNAEEMWADVPRQLKRRSRKAVGLPASSDVGTLSVMVKKLRARAESRLSQVYETDVSITSAVISYPTLVGLSDEDIADTATYLGMDALKYFFHQPREIVAAYAGHGEGLCESYSSFEECHQEGLRLPLRQVLLVECTNTAVLAHVEGLREAIDLADPDVSAAADFQSQDASDSPYERPRLVQTITHLLEERYRFLKRPKEMMVIVTGERANAPLLDFIFETVRNWGPEPHMVTNQAEFVAAQGAAEMAWRSDYRATTTALRPL